MTGLSTGGRSRASQWWRDAVIYQIYPRSFADSNGDGVGDLRGITTRLSEVAELGVDAVWLSPFYLSPQADGGYDVADHRAVDPLFGDLDDFDALLAEAHRLGLRLIVDLVPNHTSDQHPWFQAALASPPGSAERARYLFRDGRGPNGEQPPNDWRSVFGGGAWSRVVEPDGRPGEWYLHLFAPEQPDLDWTCSEVRDEFESILRFWFDRGVDGFRIDVAHGLVKDATLPDLAGEFATAGLAEPGHPHWDRDEVHDVYRSWRRVSDSYEGDRAFVAEAYLQSPERLAQYVRADELHTAFNFRFLLAAWDAGEWRDAIEQTLISHAAVGAPATWVLSNHDVIRHVTRYGGGDLGLLRARAATLTMLALPGSAYLYQGEELGLPEVTDLPDDELQDPTFRRSGGVERGRDGCRVPLPWSGDQPSFGFSPGAASWLSQPASWAQLTRDREHADPGSTLQLYRAALARRRSLLTGSVGPSARVFRWIDTPPGVLAFARGDGFACVLNLGDAAVEFPDVPGWAGGAQVALSSGAAADGASLRAATAVWLVPSD